MDEFRLNIAIFLIQVIIVVIVANPENKSHLSNDQVDAWWGQTWAEWGHLSCLLVKTSLANQLEHHDDAFLLIFVIIECLFLPAQIVISCNAKWTLQMLQEVLGLSVHAYRAD